MGQKTGLNSTQLSRCHKWKSAFETGVYGAYPAENQALFMKSMCDKEHCPEVFPFEYYVEVLELNIPS